MQGPTKKRRVDESEEGSSSSITWKETNDDLKEGLFPNPFGESDYGDGAKPKTLLEQRLVELSGAIREKVNWTEKLEQPPIVEKWKEEAKEQGATDEMIDYVLKELKYFATLKDGPVVVSSVDGVYQADSLIPAELKQKFIDEVRVLEDVPDSQKDWHPGSNNQVLDLVHPSLYCFVSGVTKRIEEGQKLTWNKFVNSGTVGALPRLPHRKWGSNYEQSERFQWLPAEFKVNPNGKVKITSYINNLHPLIHAPLYDSIASIFERFVPMFNKVLTESASPRPPRIEPDMYNLYDDNDGDYETREPKNLPQVPEFVEPPKPDQVIELRGRRLQVIVKLANIILTPDNPTYNGGAWHVEGMKNEMIVASGIYYYVSHNITPSRLQFREAVCEPDYEQSDDKGVAAVYGLANEEPLNQPRGSVLTIEDRCIAFPNILQHRVSPFKLEDETKPGYRKILVFFLVDPSTRIISTATVPPQQKSWFDYEIKRYRALGDLLPEELQAKILSYVPPTMTLEEAKQYREELMAERKFFISANNERFFERPFSLCEH